jgi:hypothetical protein
MTMLKIKEIENSYKNTFIFPFLWKIKSICIKIYIMSIRETESTEMNEFL